MKHNKKTFWTLDRHHAAGFTLVELIVVIAILAILAGVGIPVYSGYITKANKGADQTLIGEIKHAVTLALYEKYGHELSDSVVVKLSTNGASVVTANADDKALIEAAMVKSFGENWADICKLKYDSWTVDNTNVANYNKSSFKGNEEKLLNKVNKLSGSLANFFASGGSTPNQIDTVLKKYGIDESDDVGVANSTILALAGNLTEAGSAIQSEITNAMTGVNYYDYDENGYLFYNSGAMAENVSAAYGKYYGVLQEDGTYLLDDDAQDMVLLATTATLYAYAEGLAQHDAKAAEILSNIQYSKDDGTSLDSATIALNVYNALGEIAEYAAGLNGSTPSAEAQNYFNGQNVTDLDAFFSMMAGVDQSADALSGGLTSPNFVNNAGSLIRGYIAAGSVLAAGEAGVIVNQDKSVVSYLGGIQE